jgi:Na+/H+-translocating membrane pyrophosphatase
MGNYKKCLVIALVIAAIIAIITMYYTKNQEYSVLMFFEYLLQL